MQPLGLAEDPLGFMNDFLRATRVTRGQRARGRLHAGRRSADAAHSCSCSPRIEGHPFASSTQERVMPAIARARLAASRAVHVARGDRRLGRHPARQRRGD